MNEQEPDFNLKAQRRALDKMSAELTRKLEQMILEQDARVAEFNATNTQQAQLTAPYSATVPAETAPVHETPHSTATEQPLYTQPTPRKQKHVTPPPVKSAAQAPTPQHRPIAPPPLPTRATPKSTKDETNNSVGCGTMGVVLLILVFIIRSCS